MLMGRNDNSKKNYTNYIIPRYGRGEGIGVVILKDYDAAVRDGDPIKLVILDAATAHDGRLKSGILLLFLVLI